MNEFLPCYFVNDNGEFFSTKSGTLKKIKPNRDGNGYLQIRPWVDGNQKALKAHRVVCEMYNENPDSKPCVNHKNGNRKDNRSINLEWVTYKENSTHQEKELGRSDSKPVICDRDGFGFWFRSTSHAARNGFSRKSISNCLNGKQLIHKEYYWSECK